MTPLAVAGLSTTAIALPLLLVAERRGQAGLRRVAKTAASLGFVALGYAQASGAGGTARLVLVGLVLGAIGDVALTYEGERAFLAGLGAFLAGHVAYLLAAARLAPDPRVTVAAGAVLIGVGLVAWRWMAPGVSPGLRVPVLVYVATIVLTAALAAGAAVGSAPWTFGVGVGAFLVSDLDVARQTFVAQGFANKAWGLPLYYAGQVLIAWSVGGLPG